MIQWVKQMKFSIIDEDNFNIYINNKYLTFDSNNQRELYNSLKKILISIRKKYAINIYGFFEVDIYTIRALGTILKFHKKDDDSLIYKTVDLKIIEHENNDVYLKFEDYDLIKKYKNFQYYKNNYYININDIEEKDIERYIEFFEIILTEG